MHLLPFKISSTLFKWYTYQLCANLDAWIDDNYLQDFLKNNPEINWNTDSYPADLSTYSNDCLNFEVEEVGCPTYFLEPMQSGWWKIIKFIILETNESSLPASFEQEMEGVVSAAAVREFRWHFRQQRCWVK